MRAFKFGNKYLRTPAEVAEFLSNIHESDDVSVEEAYDVSKQLIAYLKELGEYFQVMNDTIEVLESEARQDQKYIEELEEQVDRLEDKYYELDADLSYLKDELDEANETIRSYEFELDDLRNQEGPCECY